MEVARGNAGFETCNIETLTPETAGDMLTRNKVNRPLVKAYIHKISSDIINNQYQCNGETIKIDVHGNLIDGQHRLHGIVVAGRAVRSYVARGLAPEVRHTIGTGRKVTLADSLGISAGYNRAESKLIANTVKTLLQYENADNWLKPTTEEKTRIDNQQVAIYEAAHRVELTGNMQFLARSVPKTGGVLSQAERLFFYTIFNRQNPDLAKQFVDQVFKGMGLTEGTTASVLRSYLLRCKDMKHSPARVRHTIIKGWNLLRTGRNVRVINSINPSDSDAYYAN